MQFGNDKARDSIKFPVKNVPILDVHENSFANSMIIAELKPTDTSDINSVGQPFNK